MDSNNKKGVGAVSSFVLCAALVLFFMLVAGHLSYFFTSSFLNAYDQSAAVARSQQKVKSESADREGNPYQQILSEQDMESPLASTEEMGFAEGGVAGSCNASFGIKNPILGDQHVAVILVDFAQDGSAQPVADVEKGMFTAPNSIKKFVEAASFGKATISGDVFGWYAHAPISGCNPTDAEYMEMMNMVPSDVQFQDYSRIIFIFNGHLPSCQGGVSTLGKINLATPDGNICASRLWEREKFFLPNDFSQTTQKTVAHELLHSFGVPFHANAYVCASAAFPQDNAGCTIGAYGDLFDVMGLALQSSHPNSVIKDQLGWLSVDQKEEVSGEPGEYTYTLTSISKNNSGTKQVSIPLPEPVNMLTATGTTIPAEKIILEYRDMTGFDFRTSFYRNIPLARGGVFPITNTNGVLVHAVNCSLNGYCITDLLDMHPTSIINPVYAPNKVANAYLLPGEEFTVPGNSITIKTLSSVPGQSVTVKVQIDSACPADFDNSGVVDGADLATLLGGFDSVGENIADINNDAVVDGADLGMLLGAWGACLL